MSFTSSIQGVEHIQKLEIGKFSQMQCAIVVCSLIDLHEQHLDRHDKGMIAVLLWQHDVMQQMRYPCKLLTVSALTHPIVVPGCSHTL